MQEFAASDMCPFGFLCLRKFAVMLHWGDPVIWSAPVTRKFTAV